eukprot:scaffold3.g6673.t1
MPWALWRAVGWTPDASARPPARLARPRRGGWAAAASHYELLGVPPTAGRDEIKRAFRRLARTTHPDVNSEADAAQRFQEISRAFEVLTDDLRRAEYDRSRRRWRGRAGRAAAARPGADVRVTLSIDLAQAALGSIATVTAEVLGQCGLCGGSGRQPGREGVGPDCAMCRGAGEVAVTAGGGAAARLGRLRLLQACPGCAGRGFPAARCCARCGGEGLARQPQTARVVVPAGVETGCVVRVHGQGNLGCPPGDLLVSVQVREAEGISRQGQDLRSRLAVPLWDALLGGSATVATLYGEAQLPIPPGTQHGTVLALARAGVQRLGGQPHERGAHLFEVCLELPGPAGAGSERQRLLRQLAALQERQRQPAARERGSSVEGARGRRRAPAAGSASAAAEVL